MIRLACSLLLSLLICYASAHAATPDFPGAKSQYQGFDRYDFDVDGKKATVVVPKQAAPGNPWLWHGEFFGHKTEPDVALLNDGFFIVYMHVPNMLGSPTAVAHWNALYQELTEKYGLAKKPALTGLSRGGLYAYNWAAANPEKVACIYGDAPVCDIKSWPGGKGKGQGSAGEWKRALQAYGFADEAAALAYDQNPVDKLEPLAKAGVPLLHVYGDADDVVPWDENTGVIAERYKKLGGDIQLIAKPGVGHHPHGLEDPTPIVDFVVKHASVKPTYEAQPAEKVKPRDGLGNVLKKLNAGQPVKIAYLGGSITAANGWRVKSFDWFRKQFPQAKVDEIHAAIGGTGSDLGVFRIQQDALQYKPDLLFVEFAVNDGGAAPEQIWKAMEGIVRQTWTANPETDICFVYTYRTSYEEATRAGLCPRAASAMEMLADHYAIPSINFNLEVVKREGEGTLVFQAAEKPADGVLQFSKDGVHPLDAGHELYAADVAAAVEQMKDLPPVDHAKKLATPFVADNWEAAKMVPLQPSMLKGDWKKLTDADSLQRSFGKRLGQIWEATEPGSELTFKFRGSQAKLYDIVGPNGGQVSITVDGVTRDKLIPRFDSYCTYHRIATLRIAYDLDPQAVHTVTIKVDAEQPDRTPVAFRLKDPETELKAPKYQGTNIWVGQIQLLGDLVTE
ncbi:GDSL-type esterase/lipase family protein [Blastopirellula marina]|uniref:Acyl-CoA thioesterase I-like protein n=1 Tax=Blastopirellula marina DSM 3645 TaxID=314230 RepID=A3ZQX2_9BACT|nr:GDSL-type esterase/lipase family protein [Blastopirellula marina]EAQ81065.1 acyl-CoA thioesterase I-like protein [Blastopirellula marina DSM 3645]